MFTVVFQHKHRHSDTVCCNSVTDIFQIDSNVFVATQTGKCLKHKYQMVNDGRIRLQIRLWKTTNYKIQSR